jgi:hypothetical protein
MRRHLTFAIVTALLALLSLTAGSYAAATTNKVGSLTAATAPVAHTSCVRARILGQSKCIARGQYCTHSRAANRDYHRYGFTCGKRDYNGRYHLVYYY